MYLLDYLLLLMHLQPVYDKERFPVLVLFQFYHFGLQSKLDPVACKKVQSVYLAQPVPFCVLVGPLNHHLSQSWAHQNIPSPRHQRKEENRKKGKNGERPGDVAAGSVVPPSFKDTEAPPHTGRPQTSRTMATIPSQWGAQARGRAREPTASG